MAKTKEEKAKAKDEKDRGVAQPAAVRPDPKTYDLDTGIKNLVLIDGLNVPVDSRVYRLLVMLDKKAKSGSKSKSAAK